MNTRVSILLAGLWACAAPRNDSPDTADPGDLAPSAALLTVLEAGEELDVLVVLDDRSLPSDPSDLLGRRALLSERRDEIAVLADELLASLPRGAAPLRTYDNIPVVVLRLSTPEAARALGSRLDVLGMEPDTAHAPLLTESLGLIGQPVAASRGQLGAGAAVAILDTGVERTHPDLGACTDVGAPASCRVVFAQDFADDDHALDDMGHGTNVAAIAAAVAPGADLLDLDVFEDDGYAYSSVILAAIDWTIANQEAYGIAAINMSLGSGGYEAPCHDVFGSAIASAHAAGIAVVVASGNDGRADRISTPACNAGALSVGAVYDEDLGGLTWSPCPDPATAPDQVTCFSNSADYLDLLAPGALITAGGVTMAGTSQATPHVAGAVAVLRGAHPDWTVDELEAWLKDTGVPVTDPRNALTFPRLDLDAATAPPDAPEPPILPEPPTGTVSIDAGAPLTRRPHVTLTLSSDTAVSACVSNTTTCTRWRRYRATVPWTLAPGDGEQTVYATFRDGQGTTSATVHDTIVLDHTPPSDGTVQVDAVVDPALVEVRWSGFSDAGSGIVRYRLVADTAGSPAPGCPDPPLWTGTETMALLTGLPQGALVHLRVCAVDAAGTPSAGALTRFATVRQSTGSISIDGGAAWTDDTRVTLSLASGDSPPATAVCLSNTATCGTWTPMVPSRRWTLDGSTSTPTVHAWYRSAEGVVSGPVSDAIGLDTTPPTDGVVTAIPGQGQVRLSWSGFSDTDSGVQAYVVVHGAVTPPPGCAGAPGSVHLDTDAVETALAPGVTLTWRVCALDAVGHLSEGRAIEATPL